MRISDWSSDVCSSDLLRGGGGDDDRLERGLLGPALPAVAVAGVHVVELELRESTLGDLQQLGLALDRVNPPGDPRQDGRLVTRPGAALQNPGAGGQMGQECCREREWKTM